MLNQSNMTCKDCPYIKDEYDGRENYLNNRGYVEDTEYSSPDISRSCYCDKVGGKLGWWGYCADAKTYQEPNYHVTIESSDKEKHRKRRHNTAKYKNKLRWQSENLTFYPSPCYPVDKHGHYTDDKNEIAYYKETNKSKHADRYRYYKKQSNKAIRRHFNVVDSYEWYCFHEPWMNEDPEYMSLYCDEFGWEWDIRDIIDEDPKYSLGSAKGAYKKAYEYWWTVD